MLHRARGIKDNPSMLDLDRFFRRRDYLDGGGGGGRISGGGLPSAPGGGQRRRALRGDPPGAVETQPPRRRRLVERGQRGGGGGVSASGENASAVSVGPPAPDGDTARRKRAQWLSECTEMARSAARPS